MQSTDDILLHIPRVKVLISVEKNAWSRCDQAVSYTSDTRQMLLNYPRFIHQKEEERNHLLNEYPPPRKRPLYTHHVQPMTYESLGHPGSELYKQTNSFIDSAINDNR